MASRVIKRHKHSGSRHFLPLNAHAGYLDVPIACTEVKIYSATSAAARLYAFSNSVCILGFFSRQQAILDARITDLRAFRAARKGGGLP